MQTPVSSPLRETRWRKPRRKEPSGWPGLPIGRIFGLDIRVDFSWLIIFSLVAMSMVGYYSQSFPELRLSALWAAALGTTVVFFASLLLHEVSHSLVARAKGLEVKGITLFMFGGVSQIREEPRRPWDEFLIALVGPVTSVLVGLVFLGLQRAFAAGTLASEAAGWLGWINLTLAVFNLLPGFPLDGGRMLRSVVWGLTKDLRRATRVAALLGAVIAFALVGWGMIDVFWNGRFIEGLWFGLIGWFLLVTSRQSVGQAELRDDLRQLRVEQAMGAPCPRVPADLPLEQFVDEFVFKQGGTCFFVTQDDRLQGVLTLADVRQVDHGEWTRTRVGDIMTPLAQIKSARPSDSLLVAFERMNEHSLSQLPVLEGDRILGVITQDHIVHLVAKFLELTAQPGRA